jgi:hypothetical protein
MALPHKPPRVLGAKIVGHMQTLGLSESTPRTESRWRALFWPTIRNDDDFDFDYITTQGFWICSVVATATIVFSAFTGSIGAGAFEGVFYFLAGIGVRERSRAAAIAAFTAYLLSALVLQRYTGAGFSVMRVIFLALLFTNIRGGWLSARWQKSPQADSAPIRLNQTIGDKLADQLPRLVWPKARFVFYVLAGLEMGLLLFALFAPRGWAARG